MVVDKGYKQTEVGVIPEDWDALPISEIAVITTGGSDTQDRIDDGEFPFFVRSQNVERINKYTMECEAILTSGDGVGVGKIFHYIHGKFDFHQRVYCIYNFNQSVLGKYLYYQFSTNFFNRVMQLTAKSSVDSVRREMIADMKLPFPKTTIEQTAIANALLDMDALIGQTEKLIEKKKAIKQGVMQELLKPKEGWVTKKLGEIGEISGAGVDKKIVDGEVPVRLVNYMDVYKRDFIYSNELSHWVTAPNQKLLSCQVRKGDVFFTPSSETREDIALPAVAMEDIGDAVYSYHLVRFRAFDNWDLRFKAYIFNTIQFLQQAEKQCEGSGKRYVLTLPKFRSLLISYPSSVEEQEKISDIIWDIDIEIQTTETKLQKLKLQKQGMMQALLTGKIRLI